MISRPSLVEKNVFDAWWARFRPPLACGSRLDEEGWLSLAG